MAGFEDAIACTGVGDRSAIEHNTQSFDDFLNPRRARIVPHGFLTGLRFYALRFKHVDQFLVQMERQYVSTSDRWHQINKRSAVQPPSWH
jgi:hypothetical protein